MDTLQEKEAMKKQALGSLPLRGDGTVDISELARRQLEQMLNQVMDWQADELCGEGNRRNGYRERRLLTLVGEVTLRIPKLREGYYFPEELVRPYSRVDRAMVEVVKEVYARGLSTRKIERAAEELGFGSISPSRVSRMTAELDEEVACFAELSCLRTLDAPHFGHRHRLVPAFVVPFPFIFAPHAPHFGLLTPSSRLSAISSPGNNA